VCRHKPCRWFPPWWKELFNFLRIGYLVATEDFEVTAQAYFGNWTFEEAYARTGRNVSIIVSSNFTKLLPGCMMLNHITAPKVTLASAVATSCTAPGVMQPRGLVVKDASGELKQFDLLGKSFRDGTITNEMPKDYLRSCFGVSEFLVSQVNPHVSPFIGIKSGIFQTFRSAVGRDLQSRAQLLSEYQLVPSFFGRSLFNTTKHLSQDFSAASDGVTVFPPNMGFGAIKAAVTNPSIRDMEHYILEGQRMTWSRATEIRLRMQMEFTIAKAIKASEGTVTKTPFSREQPPSVSDAFQKGSSMPVEACMMSSMVR